MTFSTFTFFAMLALLFMGAEPAAAGKVARTTAASELPRLFETDFRNAPYGCIPDGWRDLIHRRPSRNWAVDGNAFLRPLLNDYTGLLVFEGDRAIAETARTLTDAVVSAEFKMTEDAECAFGIAGRVQGRDDYYLARFVGGSRLELVKIKAAKPEVLSSRVTNRRYREGERWRLSLELRGDAMTARVIDASGSEAARVDARDEEFKAGPVGLSCTTYAAASSFRIARVEVEGSAPSLPRPARHGTDGAVSSIARSPASEPDYPVVRPHWKTDELNTPFAKLAANYDLVVAGAGTGGFAAAVQAARMGSRVLLLEETDWIGGQMCAAAVASMDEDSVWMKYPVRERGLYREFHESMVTFYRTLDKDPFVAYYTWPKQTEGGYEPKTARAVLYGFIKEARDRKAVLDLSLRSRVIAVRKQGDTVTGVTVECAGERGAQRKDIACKILIDATEYGDVIPLTGARYRVGNVTSDAIDPAALVQDHTWTAVIREYPDGIPDHLKLTSPPPGYEEGAGRRYRNYQLGGTYIWGGAGKGIKGPRDWRVYFAWRGMADSDSPLTGERSGQGHTQCGINGGNDYPVTVATCEDPAQRRRDERDGIHRTLGTLYYFQHELGLNWSLAEDEGYDTPYNRAKMKSLELRPDVQALAVHLPQMPYVREARRFIGVRTLVAADLTRFEQAKHFSSSVAMGDYFMDLDHGATSHALEPDLDAAEPPKGGGPFQVPFEVFIPEKIDGFLPAEKNLSQSRLANGATRLQPITMLTGQAAGTIAALAVQRGVQPRALDVMQVQSALLDAGSTLIQRWYADVPWGTPLWKATQLLALHQVMDRPGAIDKSNTIPLAANARWGVDQPLTGGELKSALTRLVELKGLRPVLPALSDGETVSADGLGAIFSAIQPAWGATVHHEPSAVSKKVTAGEFSLLVTQLLLQPFSPAR